MWKYIVFKCVCRIYYIKHCIITGVSPMDLLGITAEVHDLKRTVYSKSAKINELEDKITKLMVENQKLSEQLSDNLQAKFSVDSIVKRESKSTFCCLTSRKILSGV